MTVFFSKTLHNRKGIKFIQTCKSMETALTASTFESRSSFPNSSLKNKIQSLKQLKQSKSKKYD